MSGRAKLLLAGAGVLLALMLFMLHELRKSFDAPVPVAKVIVPTAPPPPAPETPWEPPKLADDDKPTQPGKLDVRSDQFFQHFDERIPKMLTSNAAKCYEGRHGSLSRNQRLALTYKVTAKNGQVTISDVKVKESSLKDDALQTCFMQQIANSTWKDDELPDVGIDDEIVLSPERGMKKYWKDNQDYVGAAAPPP
jgi:hypothetical protein